jgi:hypothetical protein
VAAAPRLAYGVRDDRLREAAAAKPLERHDALDLSRLAVREQLTVRRDLALDPSGEVADADPQPAPVLRRDELAHDLLVAPERLLANPVGPDRFQLVEADLVDEPRDEAGRALVRHHGVPFDLPPELPEAVLDVVVSSS